MLFASLFYPRENEDCGVIEDVVDISYSHLNVVCSLNECIDRLLNDALFFCLLSSIYLFTLNDCHSCCSDFMLTPVCLFFFSSFHIMT